MKPSQKDLRLLPNNIRIIGYGLLCLSVIGVAAAIGLHIHGIVIKEILKIVFMISLLILALSKDKVEDELTLKLRLKAFAASFIFGAVGVIINPLVNLLIEGSYFIHNSAFELLTSMLFFYFLIYYLSKRSR